jgi:hypothetical protein
MVDEDRWNQNKHHNQCHGERSVSEARAPYRTKPSCEDIVAHLDSLLLLEALWWFIENVTDDHPQRQAAFFHLRTRVREENWRTSSPLAVRCRTRTGAHP